MISRIGVVSRHRAFHAESVIRTAIGTESPHRHTRLGVARNDDPTGIVDRNASSGRKRPPRRRLRTFPDAVWRRHAPRGKNQALEGRVFRSVRVESAEHDVPIRRNLSGQRLGHHDTSGAIASPSCP